MQEMWVLSLGQEYLLEKEMATYSGILERKIPWTEEPGGLQCMGLQRVGHDLVTEHTHNLDPEFKFLTLCQKVYQMFSLKFKELSIAFN